jgi:hypothetical protein
MGLAHANYINKTCIERGGGRDGQQVTAIETDNRVGCLMASNFFLTCFHPVEYVYCYLCIVFISTFSCPLEAEYDLSNLKVKGDLCWILQNHSCLS